MHLVEVLTGPNKRCRDLSIWSSANASCELIFGRKISFRILCLSSHDSCVDGEETSPIMLLYALLHSPFEAASAAAEQATTCRRVI